jgi:hypothetical protein
LLLAPRLELEDPTMQIHAADAERVLLALVRAGDVSVQRNGQLEPDIAHRTSLASLEDIARPASIISVDLPQVQHGRTHRGIGLGPDKRPLRGLTGLRARCKHPGHHQTTQDNATLRETGEPVSTMTRDLHSGTVTLLFTDIEGSTKLLQELGSEAYARALAEHRRTLRQVFTAHQGVEVDTQGDLPPRPGGDSRIERY